MNKRIRLLGLLLAFAIPFGYATSAAARPPIGSVQVCGNATYYCSQVLGYGWLGSICWEVCGWG